MDDLNAPLGMDRKPKTANAAQPQHRKPRGLFVVGFLFLLLAGLNAYAIFWDAQPGETQVVRLPDPVVETAQATPENQLPGTPANEDGTPEVNVIYGTEENGLSDDEPAPLPVPAERETITEVSPGGPRIITVRDPTMAEIGQPPDRAHLPVDDALEETAQGMLPIRTPDGRRPVDLYARPWSSAGGKRIALVIGGLGLSQTGTQRAIEELPPEITLAFAPTGFSLDRWMKAARKKGHELLIQVPMEPFNYPDVNPGPNTLRLASSPQTNVENLDWALGKITNYTGVANYLGARFMADKTAMKPILDELGKRGLLYFNDGSAGAGGSLGAEALRSGVPYASANVVIDISNDPASIRAKLKALEALASARGDAIGYGSALDLTVTTVAEWANEAKKNGFEIVGVAALSKDPERRK